jgi:hypothetical protein
MPGLRGLSVRPVPSAAALTPASAAGRRVVVALVTLTVTLAITLAPRTPVGLGHHRDVGRGRRRRATVATAAAEAAAIATATATEAAAIATTAIATAAAVARRTTGTTIEPCAAAGALARRTTGTTIEPCATAGAVAGRTTVAAGTAWAARTPIITLDARGAAVAAGGAVEAARSRATTTPGPLLCLVHAQRASVEVGTVHRGGRRLRLGLGGQFDESEAARSARLTVHHQEDVRYRTPIGAERLSEGIFSRAVCQVAYVESRSHCEAQGPSAAHRSIVSSFTRTKVSS